MSIPCGEWIYDAEGGTGRRCPNDALAGASFCLEHLGRQVPAEQAYEHYRAIQQRDDLIAAVVNRNARARAAEHVDNIFPELAAAARAAGALK